MEKMIIYFDIGIFYEEYIIHEISSIVVRQ